MGFQEGGHRGEESFSSRCIKGPCCQHDITMTVDPDQLAEGVFVKLLHEISPSFLPIFLPVLCGSHFVPIPKEVGSFCSTSLRMECLCKFFGIRPHKMFVTSPHVLINVSVDSWVSRHFFHTLGSSTTLLLNLFQL